MHSEEDPKPDPSLEALAARLRALPEPAVPANLEARLLAAIASGQPARVSPVTAADSASRRQAWLALASTVLALAMVGMLAVFGWKGRGDNGLVSVADAVPPAEHEFTLGCGRMDGDRPVPARPTHVVSVRLVVVPLAGSGNSARQGFLDNPRGFARLSSRIP